MATSPLALATNRSLPLSANRAPPTPRGPPHLRRAPAIAPPQAGSAMATAGPVSSGQIHLHGASARRLQAVRRHGAPSSRLRSLPAALPADSTALLARPCLPADLGAVGLLLCYDVDPDRLLPHRRLGAGAAGQIATEADRQCSAKQCMNTFIWTFQ
ncbi:hypothetical protein U9M48_006673 [Paspalum notatum var. saurae]|uniref:Uncharacterized protein n=1 Tax=Paspalum notatum var. saurae TaxID=547442 RepID=A0AAQ3SGD9_PASNO